MEDRHLVRSEIEQFCAAIASFFPDSMSRPEHQAPPEIVSFQ
jgi:hypothetical protein